MSTKWNESTNPLEKKPLSDLQKRGLEAAEQRKSDRLERSMKRLKKEPDYPAKVISYDVNLGVYNVQKGSDVYQARSITNGAIAPGDNVALKPGTGSTALIDQMWVPKKKKVVEEGTGTPLGRIMYAYTTVGDTLGTTALYVAGFQDRKQFKIDEWLNSQISLSDVCLDNLGGSSFIISYVLFNSSTNQFTYKVGRNSSNSFLLDIPKSTFTSTGGGNYLRSIGYGNWIENSASAPGGVDTRTVFRLSDPSINNLPALSLSTYTIASTSSGNSSSTTASYTAYLSPFLTATGIINQTGSRTNNPLINGQYVLTGIATDDSKYYTPIRYNTNLNKGLYIFSEYNGFTAYQYFMAGPGFFRLEYSGTIWSGYGLIINGSATQFRIFDGVGPGNNAPNKNIYEDHVATVSVAAGSNVATVISGNIPPKGVAVSCTGFAPGSVVIDVNASQVTLDRVSNTTTTFGSMSWYFNAGGNDVDIDFSSNNISWIYLNSLTTDTLPFSYQATGMDYDDEGNPLGIVTRTINYAIAKLAFEKIKIPVNFYGDDLIYKSTKIEAVYPPSVINRDSNGRYVFSLRAASYSPN